MSFERGYILGLIPHSGHLQSPQVFGLFSMLTKCSLIITSHQDWFHGYVTYAVTQIPLLKKALYLV